MDVVDIYGHLDGGSEIIIVTGNYNNIHGVLTWNQTDNVLRILPLPEIITPSVITLILNYEKLTKEKVYFSLRVKDTNKFINVKIEVEGDHKTACACVSSEKAYFMIDYSSIDRIPRSRLLSGSLYSIQTILGEQIYNVSWKIQGFLNGDLIIFLPIIWYESSIEEFCKEKTGIINLIESLNQLQFKGYTTQKWCETAANVVNCVDSKVCGDCMGPCRDSEHICYPDNDKFVCGPPEKEPNMIQSNMVSFSESQPPTTTGNTATWIAIIVIFIIIGVLVWGKYNSSKYNSGKYNSNKTRK